MMHGIMNLKIDPFGSLSFVRVCVRVRVHVCARARVF